MVRLSFVSSSGRYCRRGQLLVAQVDPAAQADAGGTARVLPPQEPVQRDRRVWILRSLPAH